LHVHCGPQKIQLVFFTTALALVEQFLPRDAYAYRGLCCRKTSVCPSVTRRHCVEAAKHIIKLLSPSRNHEKNENGVATGWWKIFEDMFSRFDRIPACDRQTDRLTDGQTDRYIATA